MAWYRLDEASGNRADSSGNGYTLTDNNTVGSATGLVSANAADFIKANSETLSGTQAGLVAPFTIAAAWSWVLWIYPESPIESDLASPINTYTGALGHNEGINCRRRGQTAFGSSTIAWDIVNNAGTSVRIEGTANTAVNSWSMIALVYDGSGSAFSRTNASTSSNTTGISGTLTPYSTFRIGCRADLVTGFWDGRIGPVGLWSRALTSGELDTLYNSGAGHDPTAVASGQPATLRGVYIPGMQSGGRRVIGRGWG